jgi:hypothetical protein
MLKNIKSLSRPHKNHIEEAHYEDIKLNEETYTYKSSEPMEASEPFQALEPDKAKEPLDSSKPVEASESAGASELAEANHPDKDMFYQCICQPIETVSFIIFLPVTQVCIRAMGFVTYSLTTPSIHDTRHKRHSA